MTTYSERNGTTILSAAVDPDGDPLSVVKINGDAALVGTSMALSIGGSVTVAADGTVLFDDTGFEAPAPGESYADSLIATVSDGVADVDVAVDIQVHN